MADWAGKACLIHYGLIAFIWTCTIIGPFCLALLPKNNSSCLINTTVRSLLFYRYKVNHIFNSVSDRLKGDNWTFKCCRLANAGLWLDKEEARPLGEPHCSRCAFLSMANMFTRTLALIHTQPLISYWPSKYYYCHISWSLMMDNLM